MPVREGWERVGGGRRSVEWQEGVKRDGRRKEEIEENEERRMSCGWPKNPIKSNI